MPEVSVWYANPRYMYLMICCTAGDSRRMLAGESLLYTAAGQSLEVKGAFTPLKADPPSIVFCAMQPTKKRRNHE